MRFFDLILKLLSYSLFRVYRELKKTWMMTVFQAQITGQNYLGVSELAVIAAQMDIWKGSSARSGDDWAIQFS